MTFAEFCAHAHPRLVAALHHQFGDRQLAEDLAQEALIRAGERWSRVSTLASPTGWAFHVGCNLGKSAMRRRASRRRAEDRMRAQPAADAHRDPDVPIRLALLEALEQLPPTQREALIARHHLGMSAAETAEMLGTTAGAVRVRTHKAAAKLRELLAPTLEDAHVD